MQRASVGLGLPALKALDQLAVVLESDGTTHWSQWMCKARGQLNEKFDSLRGEAATLANAIKRAQD
ncbi:hypothetical protein C5612_25690 [Pseudomonas frederiksbergensis]|uniref:Uncharacterized protein n=1 Tax=Pseudomonas frederiksbergensis TaxID=104087 RepID=A0A2S8HBN8_9PSED|nr:hypothetical protein C5612_25690 [Pseudomonas frederiksbergensis]